MAERYLEQIRTLVHEILSSGTGQMIEEDEELTLETGLGRVILSKKQGIITARGINPNGEEYLHHFIP